MKLKKFAWNDIRKPSWKVPTSKDMELTDADSLYSDDTIDFVDKQVKISFWKKKNYKIKII